MLHSTISRKGGRAKSEAKTRANRAKAAAYWASVKDGKRTPPRRPCSPPSLERLAELLAPYCRENGIILLEVFGSVARGQARRGSDVDLIATFATNPGLRLFSMAEELSSLLGVPVDLLTRQTVDQMANPYRRENILREAKVIYA